MKKLSSLLVSFTMVLLAASSVHAGQQSDKCVISIVLDTSPTAEWHQIRKTAENVYKSSLVGDTLLVFSVRGLSTYLKFSCVKRCTDDELDSYYSVIQTSTADWFINGDLARALNGPIYEKLLQHTGQEGRAIIFILSEGNLNDRQAAALCKFADKMKAAHSWPLLLASSPEKTNRQLLIAAGKGRLRWCKLSDAADRALMEKLIREIRSGVPIVAEKDTAAQPTVVTNKKVTFSEKDTAAIPAEKLPPKNQEPHATTQPSDAATTPPTRPVKKPRTLNEVSEEKAPEPNKPSEPNVFKPQPSLAVSKAKDLEPAETVRVKPSKRPRLPASNVAEPTRQKLAADDKSPSVCTLSGLNASRKEQVEPTVSYAVRTTKSPVKISSKAPGGSRSSPFSNLTTRLLAIGGASIIAIIATLLLLSWFSAKSWQKSAQNPVLDAQRQQENQPKILMARVGSSSYHLGNLSHFTSVHIGSSPENAIRINNKAVAPQHIKIYRHGDKLFARNLSKADIVANGQKIRPHKRYPLTLPALVSIDREVGVNLFFAKAAGSKSRNLQESKNARAQNQ